MFAGLLWLISYSPFWFSERSIVQDYGTGTLDLRFASSATEALATLDRLGSGGRRAYDAFQVVDIVFPASYALALGGLIWTLWQGAARPWVAWLAAVPMVGALLDYLENVLVRVALGTFPDVPAGVLATSVTLTTAKLVLNYLAQALVVLGLLGWIVARVRRPAASPAGDRW